ncbi:hypothetical protein VTO42DRAFT_8841 [Malbranchea cinnamomea]
MAGSPRSMTEAFYCRSLTEPSPRYSSSVDCVPGSSPAGWSTQRVGRKKNSRAVILSLRVTMRRWYRIQKIQKVIRRIPNRQCSWATTAGPIRPTVSRSCGARDQTLLPVSSS